MLTRKLFNTLDSWKEFDRLQRDVNRLFNQSHRGGNRNQFPALNAWANEDKAIVTSELPGFNAEDMDISVVNNSLSIKGERKADAHGENDVVHRRERHVGEFSRTMKLPFKVNTEHVSATFKNGLLTIELPRAEEDKPRKISITA